MHLVRPEVWLMMKPQIVPGGMQRWLKRLGAENYHWQKSDSDAENGIMAFSKRCYIAFEPGLNPNVRTVREDVAKYLDNILASGHGSVLEHAHFTFGIEGVSRVFTGEMNRHRAGMAISEGSMRFISFEDLGLVETEMMRNPKDMFDELAIEYVVDAFRQDEDNYQKLMTAWKEMGYDQLPMDRKKQLTSFARRPIGMGIATGGVWTGNVRALRHICELRGTKFAEEEILEVGQLLLKIMMRECPNLFGDFSVDEQGFWAPEYHKV